MDEHLPWRNRGARFAAFLSVIGAWAALHGFFHDVFIFHDSWNHNFPLVYEVAKNSDCGRPAYWLSSDTGTPTLIYTISFSLTQLFRVMLLNWWACALPRPFDAMLIYKAQIFVIYLGFALGMFVLGRVIFRHWLSALYLMAATLFAGACMDSLHSDEVAIIMFWVPWTAAALAMAHRHHATPRGAMYVNLAALFFCLQLLDMYPHIPSLAIVYALVIYIALARLEALRGILGQWPRLWPAVLVVILTAAAFYAVYSQIFDYQPQHSRTQIRVEPSQFGQTGFMQPSAFFGSLFPLSFTAAFEEIASGYGWRGFNYRLDVLVVYLGTLPLLFIMALIPRRGFHGAAAGWMLFAVVMTLTALQPTKLYLAIFHVPFFDLFRSYFHFFDYAVVGLLVVSGYGFDRIVNLASAERMAALRSALLLFVGFFALGALALIAAAVLGRGHGPGLPAYRSAIAADASIVLVVLVLVYAGSRWPTSPASVAALAIGGLVVTQAIHVAGIYRMLGEPAKATFARYKMDDLMLTPFGAAELASPGRLRRVACEKTTGCNLAQRAAASLRTDVDGSFFRHRLSPVLRPALSTDVKAALMGVTHPFLWSTTNIISMPSVAALDNQLENHRSDIGSLLGKTTYSIGAPGLIEPASFSHAQVEFSDLRNVANQIRFHYRSPVDAFANLSITAAPGWTATINRVQVPIKRGFYQFIVVALPAGEGEVTLRYRDPSSTYLFWSRWMLAAFGLLGAISLARDAARLNGWNAFEGERSRAA